MSRQLAPLAKHLERARILVLGATGFVGSWLLESILDLDQRADLGLKVAILTRDPGNFAAKAPHLATDVRLAVHEGSLEQQPSALRGIHGITHVIHAGSDVNRRMTQAEALGCLRTLDQGTEGLLEAGSGWPLQRFLYVSSAAVYDRIPKLPGAFSDAQGYPPALGPEAAYACGKRMAELRCVLHASQDGYAAVVARLGAFLGPLLPLDGGFAAGNFVRDALAGRPIRILGDGTPLRSYQYASDLAVWLWTLLLEGRPGEAYNVGGEAPLSLRDLAERTNAAAQGPGVEVLGTPDSARPIDAYVPPVIKAREELGLTNRVGLDEALRRTLRWHSLPPRLIRE